VQELQRELKTHLERHMQGEVAFDAYARVLYSTDGSSYCIEPLGVAFPQNDEDLFALVEVTRDLGVPLIARGAGTSLAGQVLGPGLVVDCGRYLNQIIEVDPERQVAWVQPGAVCTQLNHNARKHNLMFGTDPASADRATMGGIVGNNASGAHSIRYGMSADHLLAAEVVLSDGSGAHFEPISEEMAQIEARQTTLAGEIAAAALQIRHGYGEAIREQWPKTWRRASGYNLNYLLGFSPTSPPAWYQAPTPYPEGEINLPGLLAGSEGTLVLFRRLLINLVPRPKHTVLVILGYDSIAQACDATPGLLELQPSAIELVPATILTRALAIPAYARKLSWLGEDRQAFLAVEFDGATLREALLKSSALKGKGKLVEKPKQQADFWGVRKAGLGLLMSIPGDTKPVTFIEDLSVPVEVLSELVRDVDAVLDSFGIRGEWYAHASAGCLHLRPMMNLKAANHVADMRAIAEAVAEVVIPKRGVLSGEHGDGLSRTEFNNRLFGSDLINAFRVIKQAFDPDNRFNPGKIIWPKQTAPPAMDHNLRYGPEYSTEQPPTIFAYHREGDLAHAVEDCIGAGVCRKDDGLMCPSYQATRKEEDLTRGRANALRAALSGQLPPGALTSKELYEIFELCLECKGCKAECPTGVDIARVKAEFLSMYQAEHGLSLRSRLFGEINLLARLARPFASLVNFAVCSSPVKWFLEQFVGISREHSLPAFRSKGFRSWFRRHPSSQAGKPVLLFVDTYIETMVPEIGQAAVALLEAAGYQVMIEKSQGCCGRPMISKGMLKRARKLANRNLAALAPYAQQGIPIIGLEPSCILTLRDEYLEFFPEDPRAERVAVNTFLIEEFLTQVGEDGLRPIDAISLLRHDHPWLLHGHCYAKALVGTNPTLEMLRAAGGTLEEIPSGCCGMAGSFGYEVEHTAIAWAIGELKLFPAIRESQSQKAHILAHGFSCRTQIHDGTQVEAQHPVQALAACMNGKEEADSMPEAYSN
jgi:FAD/FMN-containing dehydrogenase/Fe-S oxidoreductase